MKLSLMITVIFAVISVFIFSIAIRDYELEDSQSHDEFVICGDIFYTDMVLDVHYSKPYTVLTYGSSSIAQEYTLDDLTTKVYRDCSHHLTLTHSPQEIGIGNAINDIALLQDVLAIEYHINPDVARVRRIDLISEMELYFQKYWMDDGSKHLLRVDSSVGELVSYSNEEYKFEVDYNENLFADSISSTSEQNDKFSFKIYDYTCSDECIIITKQPIFSLEIFDDVRSMDDNYTELKEFVFEEKDPKIDGESLNEFDLNGDKEQCWKVREMKENGVVRLYSEVYCNYKDDIYYIHSNIPTPTYKSYDKEFQTILESFEFFD